MRGCLRRGGGADPPCPLSQGDLKRYLRAQRPPEGLSPELPPRDLRTLQRMGLEIARGLAHLHSHNYVHRWQPGSHREELGLGGATRRVGGGEAGSGHEGRSQERGGVCRGVGSR